MGYSSGMGRSAWFVADEEKTEFSQELPCPDPTALLLGECSQGLLAQQSREWRWQDAVLGWSTQDWEHSNKSFLGASQRVHSYSWEPTVPARLPRLISVLSFSIDLGKPYICFLRLDQNGKPLA